MPSIIKAINPETQRRIAVNGPTFNGLIKNGWRYNEEKNILYRGELKPWSTMIPTELFIAICKYLHPADLLNLSRTCHNYRDILYYLENETTKEIWKFSRSKFMPFLPNPKKINEILYIRCVLEKKCQFCMKRTGHVKTYWAYGVYSCRNCIKSASRTRGYFAQPQYLAELPFEIITDYDRLLGYQSCYYYWKEDVDAQLNEYNGIPNEKKDKWYKQKIQAGQQKMLDVCIRDLTYKLDPTTNKNYVYEILIECPSYQFHKNNGGITSNSLKGLHDTLAREYHDWHE